LSSAATFTIFFGFCVLKILSACNISVPDKFKATCRLEHCLLDICFCCVLIIIAINISGVMCLHPDWMLIVYEV